MADILVAPQATIAAVDDDDDLVHIACDDCDPNVTLCGTSTSEEESVDDEVNCVVCLDLEDYYDALDICCPKGARRV